ncbi:unnamed protein product, partial [Meganyctiphanes norvegica]
MSRLGRKSLCLHNDVIFLPHIKYKDLWSSKRSRYQRLNSFIWILSSIVSIIQDSKHQLSDYRLQQLTEELISIDKNNNNVFDQLDITPNGDKLLHGPGTVFSGSTISALVDLQDDFHPKVNVPEIFTDKHLKKQKRFLDAVMDTEVMHRTEKILKDKELIKKPLEEVLKDMWFSPYSRSNPKGVNGSSGFEHVFVGETNKNGVSGFHSWVYFFQEQDSRPRLTSDVCLPLSLVGTGTKILAERLDIASLFRKKKRCTMNIITTMKHSMRGFTICFIEKSYNQCALNAPG